MNYEEFYQEIQILEKGLNEKLIATQKHYKNIIKYSEKGDIRGLNKDISQIRSTLDEADALTAKLSELAEGFNAKEYFENGDFAKHVVDYCNQLSVDIEGEFPTYDIFPYKVKIDSENQDLIVNKKRLHCVRPLSFVKNIKKDREKYIKASFNANVFLNELVDAYDLAVTLRGIKNNNIISECDLYLVDLYKHMAPTQRARKDYDLYNFAYDLSRLYSSGVERTRDERKYEFGPNKAPKKSIRILDNNGKEQFLSTIRFFKA